MSTKFQKGACAAGGGKLAATTITHQGRRGDKFRLFHNVPAQVCERCGEVWIEENVLTGD
jgi:YgiT-type zinc finger domain-containing protein